MKVPKFNAAGFGLVVNHYLERNGHIVDDKAKMTEECVKMYIDIQEVFAMAEKKFIDMACAEVENTKEKPIVENKQVVFKW